jgi:hypothetical protein
MRQPAGYALDVGDGGTFGSVQEADDDVERLAVLVGLRGVDCVRPAHPSIADWTNPLTNATPMVARDLNSS